jgi:hypothetical protein
MKWIIILIAWIPISFLLAMATGKIIHKLNP